MLSFAWPLVFLLLPLPLAIWYLVPRIQHERDALAVPFFAKLRAIGASSQAVTSESKMLLLALMMLWTLVICAAARPQQILDTIGIPSEARNIMLAVDVSQSMELKDMRIQGEEVNRLTMVKSVLRNFIAKRQGDRLGLILFGTQAYLQTPLTLDTKTLQTYLDDAQIGIAGPRTAIGEAIGLALKRLIKSEAEAKEHVLVLLTDGQSNVGIDPVQAAQLAASKHLRIFTVGIGANEMIVDDFFGQRRVNPSQDLEEGEKALRKIAELTGGSYFRAHNTEELQNIYKRLDEVELTRGNELYFRPKKELFMWPLALAFLLSLIALQQRQLALLARRRS